MAAGHVARLTAEHIPSLVSRLQNYGVYSVQTRTVLHLLRTRLNPAPFQLFVAGDGGDGGGAVGGSGDLVTVTALQPTPGCPVVDICAPETSAGRRQLSALLRAPELAELWKRPFRVEFVAEGVAAVVASAAAQHGLRRVVDFNETLRMFLRSDDLPVPPSASRPGFETRPLEERHLTAVVENWWKTARGRLPPTSCDGELFCDVSANVWGGQRAGLAVGAFLTAPDQTYPDTPLDQPVSWGLVNGYGANSFGYTAPEFRGRGLQALVLEELSRRCRQLGLPIYGFTNDTNKGQADNMKLLGFQPQHVVQRLGFITE